MQIWFLGCDFHEDFFGKNGEESEAFELGLPNLEGLFLYVVKHIFLIVLQVLLPFNATSFLRC